MHRNKITLPIEFDLSKSTIQLIENAHLVICSYSSIAFESYFLNVPSVRVLNPEQPPIVEDEPGIKHVITQSDFLQAISGATDGGQMTGFTSEIASTLDFYFFRFDGQASHRFWTQLSRIYDLSGNKSAES